MSDHATAESMPVMRTRIGVATHVTPRASLTSDETVEDFVTAIEACIADGDYKIIVDLSATQAIDSVGIATLMDAQDQLLQKGGWIKVSGHNNMIAEIAVMTGLADYLTFLDKDGERDLRDDTRIELGDDCLEALGLPGASGADHDLRAGHPGMLARHLFVLARVPDSVDPGDGIRSQ